MTNSRPASLLANTFTRPLSTTNSESPTSPSLIRTVLRGNVRMTPDPAIARSVSGCSGGIAETASVDLSTIASERQRTKCYHSEAVGPRPPRAMQAAEGIDIAAGVSGVRAAIVDDLAVVGQLARRVEGNVAAQLRHVANRFDDDVGSRRLMAGHFDMQRHAVVTAGILDHQPSAYDLRMPLDDRR